MDARYRILDAYYGAHPYFISQHHLQSYDYFISRRLQASLESMNEGFAITPSPAAAGDGGRRGSDDLEVRVFVGGRAASAWYLDKPLLPDGRLMYPNDARIRDLNYTTHVYADIVIEYLRSGQVAESREFPRVKIGAIPIMLHSSICVLRGQAPQVLRDMGECAFDQGGYFIIGGKEKIIIPQERVAYNRLFVTRVNPKSAAAKMFSFSAVIRCLPPKQKDLFPKALRLNVYQRNHASRASAIVCSLPHVAGHMPVFALFRALGIESDEDILRLIVGGGAVDGERATADDAQIVEFLRASIVDCGREGIFTQAQAVADLAQRLSLGSSSAPPQAPPRLHKSGNNNNIIFRDARAATKVKRLLVQRVVPNAGVDFLDKAAYLGYLVNRLVRVCIGVLPLTVRDSWVHKRMDLSGFIIADLFRDVYRRFRTNAMLRLNAEFSSGAWRHSGDLYSMVTTSNLTRIFDATLVEDGMIRSFRGRWNVDERNPEASANYKRDGIVQDLNRQSYQTYVSHVRRVSTVMGTEVKLTPPHWLYAEQWGAVCPVESPDGANVGLLKHFSIACHITCDRAAEDLIKHLRDVGLLRPVEPLGPPPTDKVTRLLVNHGLEGAVDYPDLLVRYLRLLRRTGLAAPDVSVTWDVFAWEIHVLTDGGRTCRPLLLVPRNCDGEQVEAVTMEERLRRAATTASWPRLICGTLLDEAQLPGEFGAGSACAGPELLFQHGARSLEDLPEAFQRLERDAAPLELIDTEELRNVLVSSGSSPAADMAHDYYTHFEIHPALMFSPLTATIPLLNHNPASYQVFSLAQTKQGLGKYATNYRDRMDAAGLVLNSSQLPLVTTYFADRLCDGQLTHGENLVVAIMTWGGYNQEDGLIINRASVQRGMLNVSALSTVTFREEMAWDRSSKTVIANPLELVASGVVPEVSGLKAAQIDYSSLGANGLPKPGEWIEEGCAVLGMCHVEKQQQLLQLKLEEAIMGMGPDGDRPAVVLKDATKAADRTTWGAVDRVYVTDAPPGSRTCKVRLHELRQPTLGDKLASRFGQKGVVGMLVAAEDMPFMPDGTVPDLIINPHSFPKRMTIGHIFEALLGRMACDRGRRVEATCFDMGDPIAAARAYFQGTPWTTTGDTVLYSGRTGEQVGVEVFVGVNYYNRLKHMSADKINYRSTGPRNFMTHQPTQGRGNGGGLKVGEMEQHCMLSHGAASMLKESFFDRSDPFFVHIDEFTGLRANRGGREGTSLPAGVSAAVRAPVPYSFKQMTQELETMSIGLRMRV